MGIVLEFSDPKEQQALAAFQRVASGLKDIESATQRLVDSGKTAKEAMAEFGRPAQKAWQQALSEAERYGQALAKIQAMSAQGLSPATAEKLRAGAFEKYQGPGVRRDQHAAEIAAAKAAADSVSASEKTKQRAMQDTILVQDALAAGARKTWDSTRTSAEQATTTYKQRLLELSAQLKAGLIDQETHNRAVKQAKDEYDGVGKSHDAAFGAGALAKVAALAASYLSVNSAIQLMTASLEHKRQVEREAKDAVLSVADAQREFLLNTPIAAPGEQDKVIERVKAMNAMYPQAEGMAATYKIASGAVSASGGKVDQALKNAEVAMRLSPTNMQGALTTATSLMDVERMVPGATPEEAVGFQLALRHQAVSATQESVAKYLTPAAKQLTDYGATAIEAAATVTAIQATIGQRDVEGRRTGNAVVELAKQLEEQFPEEDTYKTSVSGEQELAARGTGLKTFTERLRHVQTSEQTRKEFLSKASFQAVAQTAIESLLGGRSGAAMRQFEENLQTFTPRAQWGPMGRADIERVGKPIEQQLAAVDRRLKTTVSGLQGTTQGREAALAGVLSKENMEKLVSASGAGYLGVKAEEIAFSFSELKGGDPIKRFSMAMDLAAKRLEFISQYGTADIYTPAQAGPIPETDPKRLEAAKKLREGTQQLLKQAREAQATMEAAPSAETLRPATVTEKYGPSQVPPPMPTMPTRVAPQRTTSLLPKKDWQELFGDKEDDWDKALKEPDWWKAESKRAMQEAAKNATDIGDVLQPQPLPGSASTAGPAASVDFGAAVRRFDAATVRLDAAAGRIEQAARRSPLLGSAKEDA